MSICIAAGKVRQMKADVHSQRVDPQFRVNPIANDRVAYGGVDGDMQKLTHRNGSNHES